MPPRHVEPQPVATDVKAVLPTIGGRTDSLGRKWRAELHPRDARGRFIETGGIARTFGGRRGRVLRSLGAGKVLLAFGDGTRGSYDANKLVMVARPDGSRPTDKQSKVEQEDARRDADPARGDGVEAEDFGDRDGDGVPDEEDPTPDGVKPVAGGKPGDPDDEDGAPRRWTSTGAVQEHWRFARTTEPFMNRVVAQSDRSNLALRLQSAQLSPKGHFIVGRDGESWRVYHSATAATIAGTARSQLHSKPEALALARQLDDLQVGGKPFDWESPGIGDRVNEDPAAVLTALRQAREAAAVELAARPAPAADQDRDAPPAPERDPQVATAEALTRMAEAVEHLSEIAAGVRDAARDTENDRDQPSNDAPAPVAEGAPREPVRDDSPRVLGDVPAGEDSAATGPGEVLPRPGRGDPADGDGPDAGPRGGAAPAGDGLPDEARRGAEREGAGRGDGDAGAGVLADPGAGDRGEGTAPEPAAGRVDDRPVAAGRRFQPYSQADLAPSGKKSKAKANVEAVKTLRRIQAEGRPATPQEQAVLARWSGWGSVPEVFERRAGFEDLHDELKAMLSDQEWRAAEKNTLNAHYTDAALVDAMWGALDGLGFRGGRVLEPGSGVGTFIGRKPITADVVGVELDPTTAAISRLLYPDATIRNEGFEKTNLPDGTFDAAIGNVPFGKYRLVDARHNAGKHSIHDHFIGKTLDLTAPGGVVAVLTSRYSMDSKGKKAREEWAEKADLIGAVRLPAGAHEKAAGTQVITDVLLFRRRKDGEAPRDTSWTGTRTTTLDDGGEAAVNRYFIDHPENVLGSTRLGRGQHSDQEYDVVGDKDAAPALEEALGRIVAEANAAGLTHSPGTRAQPAPSVVPEAEDRAEGHVAFGDVVHQRTTTHGANGELLKKPRVESTQFTQIENGQAVPWYVPATQVEEIRALASLRDTTMALLSAEAATQDDTQEIRDARARLNQEYDAYTARYGPLNRFTWSARKEKDDESGETTEKRYRLAPPAVAKFRGDPGSAVVLALEDFDAASQTARKTSIMSKRVVSVREPKTTADNPADALAIVVDTYGEARLSEIARILGTDEESARRALGTSVFDDPESGRLVPRAEYLSGNVRKKLEVARAAAEDDPALLVNVDALAAAVPADKTPGEINARLGASWIDERYVQDFVQELLDDPRAKVEHAGGAMWAVESGGFGSSARATAEWGTEDRNAYALIESILTSRQIVVYDKVDDDKRVKNPTKTLAANAKADEIKERFADWVWEDPERSKTLAATFNERFRSVVPRSYDDASGLTAPGLAEGWELYDHQKAAVSRIVNEPAVLLAHEVGAGKTLEMIAGAMKLRQLGLARKPAVVVPNHMLEQFTREWLQAFPQAKLLAAGSEDLQGAKRSQFVARAATGDWDAVILTQGAFKAIDMAPEAQREYMDHQLDLLRSQMLKAQARGERSSLTFKKLQAALQSAETRLEERLDRMKKDQGAVSFEHTGIDYLMIDEAHHYKNLATPSADRSLASAGSARAMDLDMKLHYLRGKTESGRVVTFATATPISNSVVEAYTMQKYLRPDLLAEAGIQDFDSWAATFGEKVTSVEMSVDGNSFKQKTRFAKFQNLGELLRQFRTPTDVKTADDLGLPVPSVRGTADAPGVTENVVVAPSDDLLAYIAELGERAELVASGRVEPEDDNMLKISSDGRKAALDMRLVGGAAADGKLAKAADNIATIYEENKDRVYKVAHGATEDHPTPGGLQVVFADLGTPKADGSWSAYGELRDQLAARGVPRDMVRFVHEARNDQEKAELFAAARNGQVAVLIGSTEKMGTGTNMQNRAVALHHIDAPWRPADVQQRDGRIVRQKNQNEEVRVIRYLTEGSFDGFMWGVLERKSGFIKQIMSGDLDANEIEDIGDTELSAAQAKALASGNPHLLEKAEVDASLQKLQQGEKSWGRDQAARRSIIADANAKIARLGSDVASLDRALKARTTANEKDAQVRVGGEGFAKRADGAEALRKAALAAFGGHRWGVGKRVDIGTVRGLTVSAQPREAANREVVLSVGIPDIPGSFSNFTAEDLASKATGLGLLQRIENRIGSVEDRRAAAERESARLAKDIDVAGQRIGKPYPHRERLAAVRRRSELLAAVLAVDPTDSDDAKATYETLTAQLAEARREDDDSQPLPAAPPADDVLDVQGDGDTDTGLEGGPAADGAPDTVELDPAEVAAQLTALGARPSPGPDPDPDPDPEPETRPAPAVEPAPEPDAPSVPDDEPTTSTEVRPDGNLQDRIDGGERDLTLDDQFMVTAEPPEVPDSAPRAADDQDPLFAPPAALPPARPAAPEAPAEGLLEPDAAPDAAPDADVTPVVAPPSPPAAPDADAPPERARRRRRTKPDTPDAEGGAAGGVGAAALAPLAAVLPAASTQPTEQTPPPQGGEPAPAAGTAPDITRDPVLPPGAAGAPGDGAGITDADTSVPAPAPAGVGDPADGPARDDYPAADSPDTPADATADAPAVTETLEQTPPRELRSGDVVDVAVTDGTRAPLTVESAHRQGRSVVITGRLPSGARDYATVPADRPVARVSSGDGDPAWNREVVAEPPGDDPGPVPPTDLRVGDVFDTPVKTPTGDRATRRVTVTGEPMEAGFGFEVFATDEDGRGHRLLLGSAPVNVLARGAATPPPDADVDEAPTDDTPRVAGRTHDELDAMSWDDLSGFIGDLGDEQDALDALFEYMDAREAREKAASAPAGTTDGDEGTPEPDAPTAEAPATDPPSTVFARVASASTRAKTPAELGREVEAMNRATLERLIADHAAQGGSGAVDDVDTFLSLLGPKAAQGLLRGRPVPAATVARAMRSPSPGRRGLTEEDTVGLFGLQPREVEIAARQRERLTFPGMTSLKAWEDDYAASRDPKYLAEPAEDEAAEPDDADAVPGPAEAARNAARDAAIADGGDWAPLPAEHLQVGDVARVGGVSRTVLDVRAGSAEDVPGTWVMTEGSPGRRDARFYANGDAVTVNTALFGSQGEAAPPVEQRDREADGRLTPAGAPEVVSPADGSFTADQLGDVAAARGATVEVSLRGGRTVAGTLGRSYTSDDSFTLTIGGRRLPLTSEDVQALRVLSGAMDVRDGSVPVAALRPGDQVAWASGRGRVTSVDGEQVTVEDAAGKPAVLPAGTAIHPVTRYSAPLSGQPAGQAPGVWVQRGNGAVTATAPGQWTAAVVPSDGDMVTWRVSGRGIAAAAGVADSMDAGRAAVGDVIRGAVADGRASVVPGSAPGVPDGMDSPEPVNGTGAGWVAVADLQVGDQARMTGFAADGASTTVAGHVIGHDLVLVDREGRSEPMHAVTVADDPSGQEGWRTTVLVPLDSAAARADTAPGGGPTGSSLAVMRGALPNTLPADSSGRALFPGTLVEQPGGRTGVVTQARRADVSVSWADGKDSDHSGSDLTVADGGLARPAGWTPDGVRVTPGVTVEYGLRRTRNYAGAEVVAGKGSGVVESVDGDVLIVSTGSGTVTADARTVRVTGSPEPQRAATPAREPAAELGGIEVDQLDAGDVILLTGHDGAAIAARVDWVAPDGPYERVVEYTDTATGQQGVMRADRREVIPTATAADGTPAASEEGDAPAPVEQPVVRSLTVVEPVEEPTVQPALLTAHRRLVDGLGFDLDVVTDPVVAQAAARVRGGMPVTSEQAVRLAAAVRGAAGRTGDEPVRARGLHRAADYLDATAGAAAGLAAGRPPERVSGDTVLVAAGDIVPGDTVALPVPEGPWTVGRVTRTRRMAGGAAWQVTVDAAGEKRSVMVAGAAPVWRLPDPPVTVDVELALTPLLPVDPPAADETQTDAARHAAEAAQAVVADAAEAAAQAATLNEARDAAAQALDAANTDRLPPAPGATPEERAEARAAAQDAVERTREAALRTVNEVEALPDESQDEAAARLAEMLFDAPMAAAADGDDAPQADDGGRAARAQIGTDAAMVADAQAGRIDETTREVTAAAAAAGVPEDAPLTPAMRRDLLRRADTAVTGRHHRAARSLAAPRAGQGPGWLARIAAAFAELRRKVVAAWREALARSRTVRDAVRAFHDRLRDDTDGVRVEALRLQRLAGPVESPAPLAPGEPGDVAGRVRFWLDRLPDGGMLGRKQVEGTWFDDIADEQAARAASTRTRRETRTVLDTAADGGPGPHALGHLDAVRGVGRAIGDDVTARVAASSPELGADPHATVLTAQRAATAAEREWRNYVAAADGRAAAAEAAAFEARRNADAITARYDAAVAEAVRASLGSVRAIGPGDGVTLAIDGPDGSPEVEALRWAEQFMPRDWIAAAGPLKVLRGDRGWYDPNTGHMAVYDRESALHELLHHFEQFVPDLAAAEWTYYWHRTATGEPGARSRTGRNALRGLRGIRPGAGHASDEVTREDAFPDPYLGREYSDTGMYELAAMGAESLFGASAYLDDDLRDWLLGVFAAAGRQQ